MTIYGRNGLSDDHGNCDGEMYVAYNVKGTCVTSFASGYGFQLMVTYEIHTCGRSVYKVINEAGLSSTEVRHCDGVITTSPKKDMQNYLMEITELIKDGKVLNSDYCRCYSVLAIWLHSIKVLIH